MKLIYTFLILYLVPNNPAAASALTKELESPSFIQTYDGGINSNANELDVAKENVNALSTAIADVSNNTKPVTDMTLTEKTQLMELLQFQYQEAISVINQIPTDDSPQFQRILKQVNDNDKLTEKALSKAVRQLKSVAITEERKKKHAASSGQQKKTGFGNQSHHKNNHRRRRTQENPFTNKHGTFTGSGPFRRMRSGPTEHHERYFKLHEAMMKGDHNYINHHIFGDGHGSWSHSTGTHEGRRLARESRRLSSKNEKCQILATCAKRMSFYDYFVFFYGDDIDTSSGEVDDKVDKLFDEKNITAVKDEIDDYANDVLKNNKYANCDNLLAMFHRTIERDGIPEWEGGTISQVCLAEGTTVYVKLAEAAATILPDPVVENTCVAKKHQVQTGNGDVFKDSVSDTEKRAVICCSETEVTDWTNHDDNGSCEDIYAAGEIDGICYEDKTWDEADEICKSYGARLCTGRELLDGCAKDSGCDLNGKEVWTDTCAEGYFRYNYAGHVVYHQGDNSEEKKYDWHRADVVCCADDEVDGFDKYKQCDDVYGTEKTVAQNVLYHEAHQNCKDKGGRLCTKSELNSHCAGFKEVRLGLWSKTPALFGSMDDLADEVNTQIQQEVEDVIITGFIKEPLVCARNLFYSEDRKEDEKYKNEYFVFGVNGEDPKENLANYQIPKALATDSPPRTEYGQMKNTSEPAFEFSSYQHLIDNYNTCRNAAKKEVRTTVEDEYGDKDFVSDTEVMEFMKTGLDKYMETMRDDCLHDLLTTIDYGLKLVFGDNVSPGYICGVQDAVVNFKKDIPGNCCLDAPFDLDGEDWGYGYECSMECKNPGSYFAGMGEEACKAQGGTYCINQVDCTVLKECVADYKLWGKNKKLHAFVGYLDSSPEIKDPKNFDECGKAREYFGHPASFVNDHQVCDDVEQLAYSTDFDFLDEFFSQGSSGGGGAVGPHGGQAAPDVPPLVLTPPEREGSSESTDVQNGQKWRATNFALEEVYSIFELIRDQLKSAKCPCDITCIAENVCKAFKILFTIVVDIVMFLLEKGFEISAFMMGEKAECNNIQPLQTWEESLVIWENMDATGKWLQQRFDDLGGYIEAETSKLYGKIDQLSKGDGTQYRRDLLNEDDELLLGLPAPDDYLERRDDYQLCKNLNIDVTINKNNAAATALRSFKCLLTCSNDEGKRRHAVTDPDVVLTVEGIDVSKKESFEIPILYENEKLADGVYLIEIPNDVDTNVFIVKAVISSNDVENEEMIVFPATSRNGGGGGSLFSFLFGFFY